MVYFSLPLTMWFLGPVWMFVGTLCELVFMYSIDYVTESGLPTLVEPAAGTSGSEGKGATASLSASFTATNSS